MTSPLLFGLSGKKRVGKDTLGACLVREYSFRRFAFADSVKSVALDINPTIRNSSGELALPLQEVYRMHGESFEGIKDSPDWDADVRRFLQNMGSTMAQRENTIWAGPLVRDAIAYMNESGNNVVITDVRFPWEVNLIRSAGGQMIRVFRSDWPDHEHEDSHISETLLDDMVPDAFFDSTPLDETFSDRVKTLVDQFTPEPQDEYQEAEGVAF